MDSGWDWRRGLRQVILPGVAGCAILYAAYHATHGSRGLIAYQSLQQTIALAQGDLDKLAAERAAWEAKVWALRPEGLDRDMVDERVRESLGLVGRRDVVVQAP